MQPLNGDRARENGVQALCGRPAATFSCGGFLPWRAGASGGRYTVVAMQALSVVGGLTHRAGR